MKYIVQMPDIKSMWSEQWNRWIDEYALTHGDIEVRGTSIPIIVNGSDFNDMRQYYSYFFKTMSGIIEDVRGGDEIYFVEGESAGIEALEYLRKMEGLNLNIKMYFHGGSYLSNDTVTVRGVNAEYFEKGWFSIADIIYVGSNYHKRIIVKERGADPEKIKVIGIPIDLKEAKDGRNEDKLIDILYAGRLNDEKGYDVVKQLRAEGYTIVCSKENNWSKEVYYRMLRRSRVLLSPAKTETLGISVMEALANNIPVVVPDGLGYTDYVPKRMRYKTNDEMKEKLNYFIQNKSKDELRRFVTKYDKEKVLESWFG